MLLRIDSCGECNVSGSDLFGPLKCWHPNAHGNWDNKPRTIHKADESIVAPWCPLREREVKPCKSCITCPDHSPSIFDTQPCGNPECENGRILSSNEAGDEYLMRCTICKPKCEKCGGIGSTHPIVKSPAKGG